MESAEIIINRVDHAVEVRGSWFRLQRCHGRIPVMSMDHFVLCEALELGKRFSPVLDKIMDDDLTDIASFRTENTSEEQRDRYMELQGVLEKAFTAEEEEFDRPAISSSPFTSVGVMRSRKMR